MKGREALSKDNSPILETLLRVEQASYLCEVEDTIVLELPTQLVGRWTWDYSQALYMFLGT